jgi:hypothetical protein
MQRLLFLEMAVLVFHRLSQAHLLLGLVEEEQGQSTLIAQQHLEMVLMAAVMGQKQEMEVLEPSTRAVAVVVAKETLVLEHQSAALAVQA